ncbi:uncharacterized protein MYU51_003941 [Penicillium brevicompactum]
MGAQAKRDSSFASNRLTKRNAPKGHLLSTFQNKQPDVKPEPTSHATKSQNENNVEYPEAPLGSSSPLSSVQDVELSDVPSEPPAMEIALPSTELGTRLGPGTDDEPLSSEEYFSESDASPPRKEVNYMTLEQKLATDTDSPRDSRGKLARTMSDMMGDSDGDDFISSWGSSQTKRAKINTYKTKNTYFNRPAFAKPAESPKANAKEDSKTKTTPKTKGAAKSKGTLKIRAPKAKKAPPFEEPETPEDSFIVPKDIMSPSSRPPNRLNTPETSSKGYDALYNSGADSPLSSTSSTFFKGMELEKEPSPPRESLCPMCKKKVDPEILANFQSQPKQRIREQQRFCETHKIRDAAEQWEQRGYPVISWEKFEIRVQEMFPEIEKLLVPDAPSYYRNTLDGFLAEGKFKNFRLTIEGKELEVITCGYYGTRGASHILDALVDRFSRSLRRLSATDRLVKTAGVAGYAQCVLVPELAMRLVKQDMSVDDEGARQIMRESMHIGQRLHPEGNDVVPVAAGFEGITAQSHEDEEDEKEGEEEEDELDEDDETGDGEESEHGEHTDDVA